MKWPVNVRENEVKSDKLNWLSVSVSGPRKNELGSCLVTGWGTDAPCICYLTVHPKHRGKGVGTSIIMACVEAAYRAKKNSIYLIVNRRNTRAAKLYHALGFRIAVSDDKQWWMSFPLHDPPFLRRLKS